MNAPSIKNTTIENEDEVSLSHLLATLIEGKWLILITILISLIFSLLYSFGKTPIYKADALLQVQPDKSGIPGIEDLTGIGSNGSSAGTEIEILKSRKIIGNAVDNLKLTIKANPNKIPLLSNIAKRFVEKGTVGYIPGNFSFLEKYSWSHESIRVSRLEVPEDLINKPLSLITQTGKKYSLFYDQNSILQGEINELTESKDGKVTIKVQELNAPENKEFTILKLSKLKATKLLQKKIETNEKGKKTGIINIALEGRDKKQILEIINNISNSYLEQNQSRSAEEASNALVFLNEQIKPVKERADIAEAKLKDYRINNQTADMSVETQSILKVLAEIDTELQRLSLRKDELKRKYTDNHPTILSISSQTKILDKRRENTIAKISELPETQQELLKLEGEYKVANTIYIDLLNKIQEFKIAKASSVGNAYILDTAEVSDNPVKPKKNIIILFSLILGLILGILIIFLRNALYHKVDNPEKLEEVLGLPVYATIPLSKKVNITKSIKNKKKKQKTLLAQDYANDPAIESLRSLRTSLHFALLESKNNIVMITGPSPGIGKSFISSNLAAVISSSNQRVLLVDADMRKGYLHNLLNVSINPGLSDLISGKCSMEDAIHTFKTGDGDFDIITRGQTPPNPSELLMHTNFESFLSELSKNYDLVLIDTPPVHAVTDPTIVGNIAGVVFMVVRQEVHTMKEIEHAVKRLSNNGIETKGFIFNGYKAKKSSYGYGYQSYYGDYKSDFHT